MEGLVPAFVAAMLTQAIDRSAWLTAILADRYGRPLVVAFAALLAHGFGNALAAIGGGLIAPTLTPNARQLVVALALASAAVGALVPAKEPDRLAGWKLGSFATAFAGISILSLGASTQFFTLAFASASGLPASVAMGAIAGAGAVHLGAALMGERDWQRLPWRATRIFLGLACVVAAIGVAGSALRLI